MKGAAIPNYTYFADANYPGVGYAVPEELIDAFADYMRGEGANLIEENDPVIEVEFSEIKIVKAVCPEGKYGLDLEEVLW